MLKLTALYGLIAGLLVGIPLFVLTVWLPSHELGMLVGYLTMLIALSAIFAAIKRHRDQVLGGVIRFWPALAIGLGISVVAGIFYVAAWEAAVAVAHLDFAKAYADAQIAHKAAEGVSEAELKAYTAEMNAWRDSYADPLYRLPMTFAEIFPVGVLVSLISAGLLRNSRFLPARRLTALCLGILLMAAPVHAQSEDAPGRITGIGGIFFKAKDPKALAAWYRDVLGLPLEAWGGAMLKYDSPRHPPVLTWSAFPDSSKYFAPSAGPFMIDYAVDDMTAFLARLKAKNVEILQQKDDPTGRFAWLLDPEGNKVELWEPRRPAP